MHTLMVLSGTNANQTAQEAHYFCFNH